MFLAHMRLLLILCVFFAVSPSSFGQFRKINKTTSLENHFLISGVLYNYDIASDKETPAANVQIVIYQNQELYVAFFGGADGAYSFYLPVGFDYDISFGGSAFVNKKVHVDATQFPEERKPREVLLDLSLFYHVDGADFSVLEQPFVNIVYDPEADLIRPDEAYTAKRKTELDKALKKARKVLKSAKG